MTWNRAIVALACLLGTGLPAQAEGGKSVQHGIASVYSHGRTASGEPGNTGAPTAAHRTLRFGTKVKVTNLKNGRSVVVRIIDRGPFIAGRIIDLNKAAANVLGFSGLTRVAVVVQN